jgi:hypothetical protein
MNISTPVISNDELSALDQMSGLPGELIHLPHRTLFQNEFVGLVLVGLKGGQKLLLQPIPTLLLTVTHGRVQLIRRNRFFTLREGGQHRLESGDYWGIHAAFDADVLFFIPTSRASAY